MTVKQATVMNIDDTEFVLVKTTELVIAEFKVIYDPTEIGDVTIYED